MGQLVEALAALLARSTGGVPWRLPLLAAVGNWALVGAVRWRALRRGVLDLPNERSSHVAPTPRGGGLGLILGFALGLALEAAVGVGALLEPLADAGPIIVPGVRVPSVAAWLGAVLAVGLVMAIGWKDDHGGATVRERLLVHALAGLFMVPLGLEAAVHPALVPVALVPVAMGAWWMFWTVSSVNVINFMDGIDGIIGAQVLVFGASLWIAAGSVGGLGLAGASLGFLLWNWSPGRIFMGDVGSGALGVLTVALGALAVGDGALGFVAAFLPLAPIFLDSAVTLVRRWRRGERLSVAHRSHLYQRLANEAGWGHARVSAAYAASSAGLAAAAVRFPKGGLPLLAAALVALLVLGAAAEHQVGRAVRRAGAPRTPASGA